MKPHTKDLGDFAVRRLLPAFPTQMIGPFIFFDHMGPADFAPGSGIDVRPHPHIGLATVTYLFDGNILHRDSLGSVQQISPGDVNWMTAGHGIVHSERTPAEDRTRGQRLHGIQTWIALPKAHEKTEPSFTHLPKASLPLIVRPGVKCGCSQAVRSAARADTDFFGHVLSGGEMEAGSSFEFPAEYAQRAAYIVEGDAPPSAAVPPFRTTMAVFAGDGHA